MNTRKFLLEAAALIGAAVLCALVANALAARERKLALVGFYPNAQKVPAQATETTAVTATVVTPPPTTTTAQTTTIVVPTTTTVAPKTTTTAPTPAPVPAPVPAPAPVTVDNVQVIEEHKGVETRRQVSPSGKSVETVPVPKSGGQAPSPVPTPPPPAPQPAPAQGQAGAPVLHKTGRYTVQVGAFSIEANAKALQERLAKLGEQATIHKTSLYLVRIGPFETREQAIKVRERLERAGISAIIVTL